MNTLYFGDNLDVLRDHIEDGSIDLVYLDPPFNSDANYNVLFNDRALPEDDAQAEAFRDTWKWGHFPNSLTTKSAKKAATCS